MPRERVYRIVERKDASGKVLIYARSSYTDRQGKRHTLWRAGETRTEAKERLKKAIEDATKHGDQAQARTTFAELNEFYKARYVKPAVYKGDIKVEGTRSPQSVESRLKPLVAYFGNMKLRRITHEDIRQYKLKRLSEPYEKGKDEKGNPVKRERSMAAVNRELSQLRKMLNIAVSQGWIDVNPFHRGDSLISLADEVHRERILTKEEEARIFEACEGDERRAHLKPILMCLMDTGMRRNEVFRLTWANLFLDEGYLVAISFKGKKRIERPVPLSKRLIAELLTLKAQSRALPTDIVFGVKCDIKRSWATVRRLAKLEGVHLHDLRHQAATNFIRSGLSLDETGKILGHRQPSTTWRYLNVNRETISRAKENLDRLHEDT